MNMVYNYYLSNLENSDCADTLSFTLKKRQHSLISEKFTSSLKTGLAIAINRYFSGAPRREITLVVKYSLSSPQVKLRSSDTSFSGAEGKGYHFRRQTSSPS